MNVKHEGVRRRMPGKSPEKRTEDDRTTKPQSLNFATLSTRLIFSSLLILLAYLIYAYFTSPTSAVTITDAHDASKLQWAHVDNDDLAHGARILEELKGPESIVVDDDGNWYTGLHDGRLLKITKDGKGTYETMDITTLAGYTAGKERVRRRPLGLRLVGKDLYVADGFQGIFVIDIQTYKWDKIVGYDQVSPMLMFADDLAISADGKKIYFTDMTERWTYDKLTYAAIEGECSGRVFKLDTQSKSVELLRGGLCQPNGIELNREETILAVSESIRSRLTILDINSGKVLYNVLLPGGADNIRPSKTGGYWTAIPVLINPALQLVNNYPFVRDIVASILGNKGLYKLASINQGIVVKLDEEFRPVSIHFDRDGKVCKALTEVQEYEKGRFLMGSFLAPGIAMLDGIGPS